MEGKDKKLIERNLTDLLSLSTEDGDVPTGLKEEIFHTIDQIELTADILDLFTFEYIKTEATLLGELEEE
ncbi:MAG: hypothetical protein HKN76_20410 [Saprospiraceae bacterium]|nr:hypothetical protein [Saprospiraceae bacterium]